MPRRICATPGCPALVARGHCPAHQKATKQAADSRRGTAQERGYTSRWAKARGTYLLSHPICVRCLKDGLTKAATVVDHVIPHKGDQSLFWDTSNWQSMCKPHHDRKTATEDGGFGRGR